MPFSPDPRAPATVTPLSAFASSVRAMYGAVYTRRVEDAIECGGFAEVLRTMHVDLAKLVDEAGRLPVTAATDFAIHVCERLAEIHDERGVRHGGRLYFGSGADVRSVGLVLYELLGADRTARPDLPLGLQAVVLRCLRTDASGRIPDTKRLAIALAPYASRSGQLRARHMQHPPGCVPSSMLGTVRMRAPLPSPPGRPPTAEPADTPMRARAPTPAIPLCVWVAWVVTSLGVAMIATAVAARALHVFGL